tara:strand:- start:1451 stop:3208 length:1758 start_codon:yes stop_codon:yes gene_type:complete
MMSLELALKAHRVEDFTQADHNYNLAYKKKIKDRKLYQNYGALLRQLGNDQKAEQVYKAGLNFFPTDLAIIMNYGNLLKQSRPLSSLHIYLSGLHLSLKTDLHSTLDQRAAFYSNILDILCNLGHFNWALSTVKLALSDVGLKPGYIKAIMLIVDSSDGDLSLDDIQKNKIYKLVESLIAKSTDIEATQLLFSMATHFRHTLQHSKSIEYFERALLRVNNSNPFSSEDKKALQETLDINSWNCACESLQVQDFRRGWSLFDWGLRTPADGAQKWQRALIKPFSSNDLPVWRGQNGEGKSLLLLEEQAIGDVMQFLTLLPTLLNEFRIVSILITHRLRTLYERTFEREIKEGKLSIYTQMDVAKRKLSSSDFDFQCAMGSICQYRFTTLDSYAPRSPMLIPDLSFRDELRDTYLNHQKKVSLLVGVSWRGGGRGKRIAQKSITPESFGTIMSNLPNVRFINLQYGDSRAQIKKWRDSGIDIVHDNRIDPLKNMDTWVTQVSACDAVISVANTTIHGSGGLNIPTQCLLSRYSDWRWFTDPSVKRSYWYPSVGIARECKDHGWVDAFRDVRNWLEMGCPPPTGPIST